MCFRWVWCRLVYASVCRLVIFSAQVVSTVGLNWSWFQKGSRGESVLVHTAQTLQSKEETFHLAGERLKRRGLRGRWCVAGGYLIFLPFFVLRWSDTWRDFLLKAVPSPITTRVHVFMSICWFISSFVYLFAFLFILELPWAGEDGLGRVCFGEL